MKVLLTGGAGYIGTVTATALEHAGHTPVVLDSLVRGPRAVVGDRAFYEGDVGDTVLLRTVLADHPDIDLTSLFSTTGGSATVRRRMSQSDMNHSCGRAVPPVGEASRVPSVTASRPPTSPDGERSTGHRRELVSFTRRGGRLKERQQRVWDEIGDRFVLAVPRSGASTSVDPDARLDVPATFGRTAPLIVEIGSGHGDTVCAAAAARPDVDFLALEVWVPGIAQTLLTIRREGLTNVRLAEVNAPEALATWLPEHSLTELHTWFPDPWHKTRHHKRRLVTVDFTHLVARALEPSGVWRLATDWADYADQMEQVIVESPVLEGGRCERYEHRPVTRFETKGLAKGRMIHDLRAVPVS